MSPEGRKLNLFVTKKEQFRAQISWLVKKLELGVGRSESLQGVTVCLQFKVINSVNVTTAGVSQSFLTALGAERGEILWLCL